MEVELIVMPDGLFCKAETGLMISDALARCGIRILKPCGGIGNCGKCAVIVKPATAPGDFDLKHLSAAELGRGMRLACKTPVSRSVEITVPESLRESISRILHGGGPEIYSVDPPEEFSSRWGMAFDLGTTTIAGTLVDLHSGREVSRSSALNPQLVHGDDVISRIKYAIETPGGLEELRAEITGVLNAIISEASQTAEIDPSEIGGVSIAANTVMTHLFIGLDVRGLSAIPFEPQEYGPFSLSPEEAGLNIYPEGRVYVLPSVAGFVGGDTVGMMLACGFDSEGATTIAVDVGTNGEIALRHGEDILVCSTAAGPALEGAALFNGMRASVGAIERVRMVNGEMEISVIGNTPPFGICGSGVIDLMAVFLDTGIVDSYGGIVEPEKLSKKAPSLYSRIIEHNGEKAFLVSRGTRDVIFTQRDIRQVQLAKAAISSGIEILLKELSLDFNDIEEILLAGAFGNYLTRSSALRIGLLPKINEEIIRFVGNASSTGAIMTLFSVKAREKAELLREKACHVELAMKPDFMEILTSNMLFS